MDIIDSCKAILDDALKNLEPDRDEESSEPGTQAQCGTQSETQSFTEGYFSDPDKNLNKILNQQSHLKRIIDQDNAIQVVKSSIARTSLEIESLRSTCTKENEDALSKRQELAEVQAKEVGLFT